MHKALDASKAMDVRDEATVSTTAEDDSIEISLPVIKTFEPDVRPHEQIATYYDDEILNTDDLPDAYPIHQVVPAYLRARPHIPDDPPVATGNNTEKALAAANDAQLKTLKSLTTTAPPVLVASADLKGLLDLAHKVESHSYQTQDEALRSAYNNVRRRVFYRKMLDVDAISFKATFSEKVQACAKLINMQQEGASIIANTRNALEIGLLKFQRRIEYLPASQKQQAMQAFGNLIQAGTNMIHHSLTRLAFEAIDEEARLKTHNNLVKSKDPNVRNDAGYRANIVMLQLIKQMKEKHGGYLSNVFHPVVAVRQDTEFTPGNLLLYEARVAVDANKKVNYGAEGARIGPLNYHNYDLPLMSIDIGVPVGTPLFISMKKEVPLNYFLGMDETNRREFGSGAAKLQSAMIVHAGHHDNDYSVILIIQKVFQSYCPFPLAETAAGGDVVQWTAKFSVDKWEAAMAADPIWGSTRRDFLFNAAKYHPLGKLSSVKPATKTDVGNKWNVFHQTYQDYVQLEKNIRTQEVVSNKAYWASVRAGQRLKNAENQQRSYFNRSDLASETSSVEITSYVKKLAKMWSSSEAYAADQLQKMIDEERAAKKGSSAASEAYKNAEDKLSDLRAQVEPKKLIFLQSCVSLLNAWAVSHPEIVWSKEGPGHHSIGILFYFKTSAKKDITLLASYSHMFRISVIAETTIEPDDMDKFQLGETGSNGYSTSDHLHIWTGWKPGIIKNWPDGWVPTPPHFFFRSY